MIPKSIFFTFAAALALFAAPGRAQQPSAATAASETIHVDATAAGAPFPHYWEQMFGSGRANLAMRAQYQSDLRQVKKAADFRYVRFHGILDDENGVYSVDAQGNPVYNWTDVDHIYDALLAQGVRPYVEISFMPEALSAHPVVHQGFWYHPVISPPASYAKWDALIRAFAQHLVDRYGIEEVSQWYFEVWNEPNIGFWAGQPAQQSYFQLYDHTARALKSVSPRLRVGGPATAQAAWIPDMIRHATENHIPLDFVSTHVYGNDTAQNVFHNNRAIPPYQMVCAAVAKVHQEILHSARPEMPLIWSEFNAVYDNEQKITDSIFMGPWLADTISQCDGMTQMMSYWSFSDVFEEQGVKKTPFYGGFGIVAEDGIPKPAYDVFALLHELGTTRLPAPKDEALVTRRADGTLVLAAWNLVDPEPSGSGLAAAAKTVTFDLTGVPDGAWAEVQRVDAQHGDTLAAWKQMGSPSDPTPAQIQVLRKASEIGSPEGIEVSNHHLTLTIPPMGLAVIEVR